MKVEVGLTLNSDMPDICGAVYNQQNWHLENIFMSASIKCFFGHHCSFMA